MSELLTAAQMRAIEQAAIESAEVTGLELMERAGRGVVEAIFEEWPELDTPKMAHGAGLRAKAARWRLRRAVGTPRIGVLCGPGNNGGYGFVIAKLLADRGLNVEVFFLGPPSIQPPEAHKCAELWYKKYKQLHAIYPLGHRDMRLAEKKFDVFVDAIFGTGLDRPLPEEILELFNNIRYERNWQSNRLVAVDILSGLNGDTGEEMSELCLRADLTVTFHRAKCGHTRRRAKEWSGKLVVKDIGLGNGPQVDQKNEN
ncbi:hydroxyethylthiazole kinase-like uncharacterized protein yjeF [Shimia isoporae]|uniref:NAD(P)H-hydrate epimerase n=1 Tax=Shimia isoporae TaxID=647720 RepID=A0A4R1NVM8_9RHOB|nr:NAD(P)H-hydrate epimerase [Shimia isoporae]TCL09142.1 hydroxyethylthiazole kinase-like uncharacterized protein yjeF [Shimia isoporae]